MNINKHNSFKNSIPTHINMINLINHAENIYASWLRNMIIIIGVGLTIYSMKDKFKLDNFYINIISFAFVFIGVLLGLITYIKYINKTSVIKKMQGKNEIDEVYKVFLDTQYIEIITLSVNIVYILSIIFICYELIN